MIKMKSKPITVRGDGTLLLDETLGGNGIRDKVESLALLEEDSSPIATFRITRDSVWGAMSSGSTLNEIRGFLQQHSRFELPQNVDAELEEYASHFGGTTLSREDYEFVLRSKHKEVAKLVEVRYSEKFVKSREDGSFLLHPSRCDDVYKLLTRQGFPVTNTADFRRFSWVNHNQAARNFNLTPKILINLEGVETAWQHWFVNNSGDCLEEIVAKHEKNTAESFREFGHLLHWQYRNDLKQRYTKGRKEFRREVGILPYRHDQGIEALAFVSSEDFSRNARRQKVDLHKYVLLRFREFKGEEHVFGSDIENIIAPLLYALDYPLLFFDDVKRYFSLPGETKLPWEVTHKFQRIHLEGRYVEVTGDMDLFAEVKSFEDSVREDLAKYKGYLTPELLEVAKIRYLSKFNYSVIAKKMKSRGREHDTLIEVLDYLSEKGDFVKRAEDAEEDVLVFLKNETHFDHNVVLQMAACEGFYYEHIQDVEDKYLLPRNLLEQIQGIEIINTHYSGTWIKHSGNLDELIREFEDDIARLVDKYANALSDMEWNFANARYLNGRDYPKIRKKIVAVKSRIPITEQSYFEHTLHGDVIELLYKIEDSKYMAKYRKKGRGQGLLTFLQTEFGFEGRAALWLARIAGWDYQEEDDVLKKHGVGSGIAEYVPAIWREDLGSETYILVSDKTTHRVLKDLGQKYLYKKEIELCISDS